MLNEMSQRKTSTKCSLLHVSSRKMITKTKNKLTKNRLVARHGSCWQIFIFKFNVKRH